MFSTVAYNTKRIIRDKGLKINAVGKKAGYTDSQFSALLNGRKIIKDVDIALICKVLNVSPNELFRTLPINTAPTPPDKRA